MIIRRPDAIAFGVRQLTLDHIGGPAVFVQQGRSHRAESVGRHWVFGVIQAAECSIQRVVGAGLSAATLAGEDQMSIPGQGL